MKIRTNDTLHEKCTICDSEEHKVCPVGGYKVELNQVYMGGVKNLVCQSCLEGHFNLIQTNPKPRIKTKKRRFLKRKTRMQLPVFRPK